MLPSFKRYREISQVLDTMMMDVETLQFKPQALVLATLFSILVLDLNILSPKEMVKYEIDNPASRNVQREMNQSQKQNLELKNLSEFRNKVSNLDEFVMIFQNFLEESFSIQYEELSPTLEFVCPYAGGVKMSLESSKQYFPGTFNPQNLNCTVSQPF
jgi:hypothetical protein